MAKIIPRLRSHREGIEALARAGFQPDPLRFGKCDHLIVRVQRNGSSGQVTISGSPGCSFINRMLATAARAVSNRR